jgi:hypothetical protein
MPPRGLSLDDEREQLRARIVELRGLIRAEWGGMSLQIAAARGDEMIRAENRIASINRQIDRRKR